MKAKAHPNGPKPVSRTPWQPLNRTAGDQRESVMAESSQTNQDQFINAYKTGTPAELEEECVFHMETERQRRQKTSKRSELQNKILTAAGAV